MQVIFHGTGLFPDGAVIGPRTWPHHDLMIVSRGHITLEVDRQRNDLSVGDAILIPPHAHFEGEGRSADAAIWVMHFINPGPGSHRHLRKGRRPLIFRGGIESALASALLAEISELWQTKPRGRHRRYLDTLADLLMTRLELTKDRPAQNVKMKARLLPAVEENTPPARVSMLAEHAGLCGSQYRALFHKAFGQTPRTHLRQSRIKRASTLLRETRIPIKDIAAQVGYSDTVAFHRAFTALTGETPGRYRKSFTVV